MSSVLLNQIPNPINLLPAETSAPLQTNGLKPELGFAFVSLDMDVRRLSSIAGVEEKAEWSHSQHGRHAAMLFRLSTKYNRCLLARKAIPGSKCWWWRLPAS
jgi:hypothetical protein